MEQTQSDNSMSSVLTPIDNNIIRTHAIRKIKRNKRNRRALFHRRKYDINKRRSQHAAMQQTLQHLGHTLLINARKLLQ